MCNLSHRAIHVNDSDSDGIGPSIVFLNKGPLILVAVSKGMETVTQLVVQLTYMYHQVWLEVVLFFIFPSLYWVSLNWENNCESLFSVENKFRPKHLEKAYIPPKASLARVLPPSGVETRLTE